MQVNWYVDEGKRGGGEDEKRGKEEEEEGGSKKEWFMSRESTLCWMER